MASTEQELGRIAGILERVVAGAERDRAEMLDFIRDTNCKLDELKETVDRQPPPPTKAEMDAIAAKLQLLLPPVIGGPNQPSIDSRVKEIEKHMPTLVGDEDRPGVCTRVETLEGKANIAKGFIIALTAAWGILTAWTAATRFPKFF